METLYLYNTNQSKYVYGIYVCLPLAKQQTYNVTIAIVFDVYTYWHQC